MKKLFLLFIFLAALMGSGNAFAQDTVDMLQRGEGKYYYSPDGCTLDSLLINYILDLWGGYYDACGSEIAVVFHTDTALTVYGIVAGMIETFPEEPVYDTSYKQSIEYLRLYLPSGGAPLWVRQARVHLHYTPISYYADFSQVMNGQYPYIPVYERYFDSAITVTGKFYCGLTYSAKQPYRVDGHTYMLEFPEFYLTAVSGRNWIPGAPEEDNTYWCVDTIATASIQCDGSERHWDESAYIQRKTKFFIFPILTPPDSTYVPDTVSADGPSMADRVTGVMPNPASESAKIVSSFGLTHIEIYNFKGTKIYDQPATGYSTTVNTSNWPAGIYIVRIYTPYGTATKRLTIVR